MSSAYPNDENGYPGPVIPPWMQQEQPQAGLGSAPTMAPFQSSGPMTGSQPAPQPWQGNTNTGGPDGLIHNVDANGNEFGPSMVGGITLGQTPQISGQYSPEFLNNYNSYAAGVGNAASSPYNYNINPMQAAQMNTGDIPQPGAQQYGGSSQLNQLLSGQGYDPATLAKMHAGATDSVAAQSAMQLSQARQALGMSGLDQSPAGVGVQQDVARQAGAAQTQASNAIDINNAQVGNQNLLAGTGMQTQIGMGNMQAANQMALENANRLFSGLQQNVQNQQQAAGATFDANTARQGAQAGAASGAVTNLGQQFAGAQLSKAANADTQNAANAAAWNTNQANLTAGQGVQNQNTLENRNKQATAATMGFNPTGP